MEMEETHSYFPLERLPDLALLNIIPYLRWIDKESMSRVNWRFHRLFKDSLKNIQLIDYKGCENVEIYFVTLRFDESLSIRWEIKAMSGIRCHIKYVSMTGYPEQISKKTFPTSPKIYTSNLLSKIISKCKTDNIQMGLDCFFDILNDYKCKMDSVCVSCTSEGLQIASSFNPSKLTIYPPCRNSNRQAVDLKMFPNLTHLTISQSDFDVDQIIQSKLEYVKASSNNIMVSVKQAVQIAKNWKCGKKKYASISIRNDEYVSDNNEQIRVDIDHWNEFASMISNKSVFKKTILDDIKKENGNERAFIVLCTESFHFGKIYD